jgi:hypothetical protein
LYKPVLYLSLICYSHESGNPFFVRALDSCFDGNDTQINF